MNTGKNNWKRNSVAVYPAFFAIGLVETLFPRLKWQIRFYFVTLFFWTRHLLPPFGFFDLLN